MSNIKDIMPGDSLSFNIYGSVQGMSRIVGIVSSVSTVGGLPADNTAATDHVNVYRELPESVTATTNDDYASYLYLTILLTNGAKINIGMPWVVLATLQVNLNRRLTVEIERFSDIDATTVIKSLELNGYTVATTYITEETQ